MTSIKERIFLTHNIYTKHKWDLPKKLCYDLLFSLNNSGDLSTSASLFLVDT